MRTTATTLNCCAAAGLLITLGVAAARPQPGEQPAPPSSKAVVMKGKAPVSEEVLRVTLPRPKETTLSNGLHLIVLEDRRVPRITLQLLIPGAGGYYDPADRPDVASATAAMMREGTSARTSSQISQQLETMAADLTVTTDISASESSISGFCLTEHADRLLEILGDLLIHPTFPEDELARYKQRMRATLIQQRARAGFLALEMFRRVAYGSHPAGRASLPQHLDAIDRQALVDFHRTRYVPDHAALAIAGDISLPEARKLVEARLAAWKKSGTPAPVVADPPAAGPAHVAFVERPGSVQTSLVVGTQAIARTHPDYDVLDVMNKVIGGGPTGRLFITLREEKGYTYGASSALTASRWRGTWQASTDVRTEVTGSALRDLLAEVARLRSEPIDDREFGDHKRAMIGRFALSLEQPQQMLGYYVTSWRYRLPADYWDAYPARITAVTRAQVQAAARQYLDPARLQIVAVGEPGKIAEVLAGFGPVERYDTEGRLVKGSSR